MKGLPIWVVYDHPSDFPDDYVARLWQGESPTDTVISHADLRSVRLELWMKGLVRLDRAEGDDPKILETWL